MRENYSRMLKLFLLCLLGFCTHGVSGQGNFTQMYFMKLTVDVNAIAHVSETLLNKNYSFNNYNLDSLTGAKQCDPTKNECFCWEGFEWSADACSSEDPCCGDEECGYTELPCVSSSTVTITGSLTLGPKYHGCLDDSSSNNYKDCNNNLTTSIKEVYSEIYGFSSLTIMDYREGSVIVDFEVVVATEVQPSFLQKASKDLSKKLSAEISLETRGVVQLKVPQEPVNFGSDEDLFCSSDIDLGAVPRWELKNYLDETKEIYNGTVSTIVSEPLTSNISLKSVTQLWTGTYTCSFERKEVNLHISHKASADMDVCVEPKVTSSTTPGFLLCESNSELHRVIVNCEVDETYEVYNVTWEKEDIDVNIVPQKTESGAGTTVFRAETSVGCGSGNPRVTCKLTNRCGKEIQKQVDIIIIKEDDKYCEGDGTWGDTKAGYTAVMKCVDSVGNKTRHCDHDGSWGQPTSYCVDLELSRVRANAEICNTGLGKLETNAEDVFTRLKSVTSTNKTINSPANLDASVTVIDTMREKLNHLHNETTVGDFLKTSSNLLDESLGSSWTNVNNNSVAEKYLLSVEDLIEKSNIKGKKINLNLEVVNCNETQECTNSVFNNSVTMSGVDATSIKTTGFKELQKYLPNGDSNFEASSIVVSTTMQPKNRAGVVKIKIDFKLLRTRPRNTELRCVFWNNATHEWSEEGCEWIGYPEKGVCECDHLSSFAILMSKEPLTVPYLTEVTYVGLAVSIISLIVCLAIELIIWSDVVKTDTLHLRHCAHVNISICLLVADVCFLASQVPKELTDTWCKTLIVVEHFCYLAMFFWMFCLSSILLHKTVYFSLHGISKTAYLRFSLVVGYVCPLLIVAITFLANNGKEGFYYSKETRWLVYNGTFKGSIFTFILPVGIIVFVNIFFMCLVIMRLLQPLKGTPMTEAKEKNSAKTVIRSVILLTPVFGLTWVLGFAVTILDLTQGAGVYAVTYIFTIMNAFQGLYIFLTTCVGDRMVREGLKRYFQKKTYGIGGHSSDSISMDQSSIKK